MDDVRLIGANAAIENADKRYNEWNLAMAAAEGNRQISMVYKKQELFKAVKKVIESCPSIDPESLRPVSEWELNPDKWTCEWFRCKKCHHTSCSTDAFCGGCGAKMKNTDVKRVIAASREIELARRQLEWIRTAERKPTAEDANEDGCVLSININPGDMNTTNWPWNMVAAFPDCLPVWMPLPQKPDLKEEHFRR